MKKVVKFGGSSLASAEQFMKVGDIIHADADRKFVVPSAPGKRFGNDTKVTDMLYGCYELAENGKKFDAELTAIKARYQEIIDGLTGNDAEGNKLHCLDLVNDTTLKANLVTFGVTSLPMLEQVKDQTVVKFPLTDLVTLIRSTGFPEGDYVFTLELEDNSNQKYEVSLTFYNPAY